MTDYYVADSDGNNSYNGLYASSQGGSNGPWKTITYALTQVPNGNTLNIRVGTYTENSMDIYINPFTIQAYNGESVIIHNSHTASDTGYGVCGDNNDGVETFHPRTNNVTFIGLKFTGSIGSYNEEFNAVAIGQASQSTGYLIIDNCEFTGFNHCAVKHQGRVWIKNSYFHDLGVTFGDHFLYSGYRNLTDRTIIEHNYFENLTGAAMHQYGGSPGGWIIRNNIFRNCGKNYNGPICSSGGSGWAMVLEGDSNEIYNNTIEGSHWGVMFYKGLSANNTVKNNIFRNCDYGVIDDEPGSGNLFDYNYFCNNSTDWSSSADGGHNIQNDTNPFVVASPDTWDDFRLTAGSACIGAGENLGTDHDDALDPSDTTWPPSTIDQDSYGDWEIGAFAYAESGSQKLIRSPYQGAIKTQHFRKIHPKY